MCRRELPQGGAWGALSSGYILHAAGHSPLHILSTFGTWPCNGSHTSGVSLEILGKQNFNNICEAMAGPTALLCILVSGVGTWVGYKHSDHENIHVLGQN